LISRWIDIKKDSVLNITKFVSNFITWILAIIITYFFIQYAFFKLLGVQQKEKEKEKEKEKKNNTQESANIDVEVEGFQKW
jgi:hypothetical protein